MNSVSTGTLEFHLLGFEICTCRLEGRCEAGAGFLCDGLHLHTTYRALFNFDSMFAQLNQFLLLSSDIRSEGSIAIGKILDFDFFMIFHSMSLPESRNVF